MLNLLSTLIFNSSSIGNLLLMFVGLCIAFGIVFFIMRQLAMPAGAFTILYVVCAVIGLIIVIAVFFGGGSGVVVTSPGRL